MSNSDVSDMLSNYVLIDSNILILAFDTARQDDTEKAESTILEQKKAEDILETLMRDPQVRIAITPLIRYEVLRGVKHIPFVEMQAILDEIPSLEIKDKESNFASEVFRMGNYGAKKNIDKFNFDIFHYSVAKENDLYWKTLDSDWEKIDKIVEEFMSNSSVD